MRSLRKDRTTSPCLYPCLCQNGPDHLFFCPGMVNAAFSISISCERIDGNGVARPRFERRPWSQVCDAFVTIYTDAAWNADFRAQACLENEGRIAAKHSDASDHEVSIYLSTSSIAQQGMQTSIFLHALKPKIEICQKLKIWQIRDKKIMRETLRFQKIRIMKAILWGCLQIQKSKTKAFFLNKFQSLDDWSNDRNCLRMLPIPEIRDEEDFARMFKNAEDTNNKIDPLRML